MGGSRGVGGCSTLCRSGFECSGMGSSSYVNGALFACCRSPCPLISSFTHPRQLVTTSRFSPPLLATFFRSTQATLASSSALMMSLAVGGFPSGMWPLSCRFRSSMTNQGSTQVWEWQPAKTQVRLVIILDVARREKGFLCGVWSWRRARRVGREGHAC